MNPEHGRVVGLAAVEADRGSGVGGIAGKQKAAVGRSVEPGAHHVGGVNFDIGAWSEDKRRARVGIAQGRSVDAVDG